MKRVFIIVRFVEIVLLVLGCSSAAFAQEIEALRQLGVRVIAGTVIQGSENTRDHNRAEIVLRPVQGRVLLRALCLCLRRGAQISSLMTRVLFRGAEGPITRVKALLHTLLGACYAVRLEGKAVEHIHVHHGFSASWIAMVACRLLGVDFSITLHGSDLLLHRAYLDLKLQNCKFCLTVSEYNRRFIATYYPGIDLAKVVVSRLGVEAPEIDSANSTAGVSEAEPLRMLAVGRLHEVKDHAFLVRACAQLQAREIEFHCDIAGDGPERVRLESLIRKLGVQEKVTLLGHTSRTQLDWLYKRADLVVLTSRSEGIPLVLMEAMARGKLVLAPAITGIPELVIAGKTGFLYRPGSMTDFLDQLTEINGLLRISRSPRPKPTGQTLSKFATLTEPVNRLDWIRHAARVQVCCNFNRERNLQSFTDLFLRRVLPHERSGPIYANSLLQQI